jgi:uncharacterized protein GlcG (DUF336 family)
MVTIRIGLRFLAILGMLTALGIGFFLGSLRPVNLAAASSTSGLIQVQSPPAQQSGPILTTDLSLQLIQSARDYAHENNLNLSFAIADASGNAKASLRMDGARFITLEIAAGKAYAAAAFGRSTAAISSGFSQNPAFWQSLFSLGHPIVLAQGALPIVVDEVTVGAMGASGGSSQQDEDSVRAALDAAGLP